MVNVKAEVVIGPAHIYGRERSPGADNWMGNKFSQIGAKGNAADLALIDCQFLLVPDGPED